MNPNEKRVFRVGVVLLALACLVCGPLVWAATRPVVPVLSSDDDAPVVRPDAPVLALAWHQAPAPVVETPARPKARPALARAHRLVDCDNARVRQTEELQQGHGSVLYCHD